MVCFALVCALIAATGSAAVAGEKWLGTWKANIAKSKFSPGPAPKEWTLKFEATSGGIKLASSGITGRGEKASMSFVSQFDGTEVPWVGNADADAAAPLKMNDNVYVNIAKKGGKLVQTVRAEVSADGKTMTITQTGLVDNHAVYERQ
jgi:hypothetical protein